MNGNIHFKKSPTVSQFKAIVIITILCFLNFNCKTISIFKPSQTPTTQCVQLGNLGSDKAFMLQKGFNNTAIPEYKTPIKLAIAHKHFTNQSYKAFTKAKALQAEEINIGHADTVVTKPQYVQMQIADKVSLIHALNKDNQYIKDYLKIDPKASLITGVSIAFDQDDLDKIKQADAVFLIANGLKTYAIQLYKDGKKMETIPFKKGVVFGYNTAYCCWKKDKRHRLHIVDLTKEFNNCPNSAYRNAKRAKKRDKLF